MINPIIAAALQYASRGWKVFPVNGKIPACPHGFKDAINEAGEVTALFEKYKGTGVGIATGSETGIGVIDIDPRNLGDESWATLVEGRVVPLTPACQTGGGGRHLFFSIPKGVPFPSSHDLGIPGIDWQSDGAYVVAAPSPHPCGRLYTWELDAHVDEVPLSPLPEWLLKIVKGAAKTSRAGESKKIPEKITKGARHEWLKSMAGKLRWNHFTGKEMLALFVAANDEGRFDPPLEMAEMERMAFDYEKKATGPQPTTADHSGKDDSPPVRVADIISKTVDLMLHPEKRPRGFNTGFAEIDDVTGGLHRGEMTIIGARTSMGKSSFGLRVAENVAADHDVLFFTVEVVNDQVVNNLLVGMAGINSNRVRKGKIRADEGVRLQGSVASAMKLRLWVDDTVGLSIDRLCAKARVFVKDRPDTLIVVDYLQIVGPSTMRVFSRQEQVAGISAALRDLARELKVPILAMAQLNREADARPEHWPMLSDLRESGSIEHDAPVVLLLHRPSMYKDMENKHPKDEAIVQVMKNRHGRPNVHFKITFVEESMRFENRITSRETDDGMEEVTA